ncbi:MAG: hypothetical protein LBS19_05855 [Clostridiales bacterium]|jgi:hypothetical protein|nr:hypothetical protein [Clostridiales bacterium]
MIREVDNRYIEALTRIMHEYVVRACQEQLKKAINSGLELRDNVDGTPYDYIQYFISTGRSKFYATAIIKKTPAGLLYQDQAGHFSLKDFKLHGAWLLRFLAFCLQKGELKPHAGDLIFKQPTTPRTPEILLVDDDAHNWDKLICVSEWRGYLKAKYQIMPPHFDFGFADFIRDVFRVTGGL